MNPQVYVVSDHEGDWERLVRQLKPEGVRLIPIASINQLEGYSAQIGPKTLVIPKSAVGNFGKPDLWSMGPTLRKLKVTFHFRVAVLADDFSVKDFDVLERNRIVAININRICEIGRYCRNDRGNRDKTKRDKKN